MNTNSRMMNSTMESTFTAGKVDGFLQLMGKDTTMFKLLLVGTGGFLGAIFRYLLSGAVHQIMAARLVFPLFEWIVQRARENGLAAAMNNF